MSSEPADINLSVNDVLRFFLELFAFFSLSFWGFAAWDFPWSIVVGILTPLVAILLWALFRSPQAVVPLGVFGRAVVEIVVMASAAIAWVMLGQLIVGVAFALVATISGIISGRKEFE